MTYQQALDYLFGSLPMFQRIGDKAFKNDLDNTLALCSALGKPQTKFKSIHIAGTNGKGTSAHTLAGILQSAGYKTGLYTSPHLRSFTERMRINGKKISEQNVVDFVVKHQNLLNEIKPSFFETTVAMAFDHFSREKVDIAVIEVGMGGRFDSTNVISPEVSLITQIGFDHQQFLGTNLEEIAFEKAGIIKPEVPVVIGAHQPDLLAVFKKRAYSSRSPITTADSYQVIQKSRLDHYTEVDLLENGQLSIDNLKISLQGDYFLQNIPGILETIRQLRIQGYTIDDDALRNGFSNIQELTGLKGRWQILNDKPLTICDIGHNTDGIKAILEQIRNIAHKKLHFIFGTVKDKKIDEVLSLLPKDATYYFCHADIPRALHAEVLHDIATTYGLHGKAIKNVNEAISQAKQSAQLDDLIFIGGSTFIVAEISTL